MKIKILTLFPQLIDSIKYSIIGRAMDNGSLIIQAVDIRQFSTNKHKKCDDVPYGGGAGMLMTVQPIYDCIQYLDPSRQSKRIFLTPTGKKFDDKMARELADNDLIILCGHYEGVDQRAIDLCIDECISIGDYILTGGELAALVVVDAVCRFCSGVLGSQQSHEQDSFANGLLEYPQYTRPQEFRGHFVPDVLLNGNHAEIKKWQLEQSLLLTSRDRPDLLKDSYED
ncbi:MAG: tRNA (guanosine(37)-N1)-methyltransferase TrmD [Firmicutes bacterium]|nr:tRNA (guanosine(37)-N1)-methyltransferase TrmD [Bacillota bacterium]